MKWKAPARQVDDAFVELLSPLLAQAIDSGKPVDIPGGYWIRAEVKEVATLAAGIGHSNTGADVVVSLAVSPGPSHKLPVLLVSKAGLATRRREAGPDRAHGKEDPDYSGSQERSMNWQGASRGRGWNCGSGKHRQMGEILRAILEDERAYLSSVYRRGTVTGWKLTRRGDYSQRRTCQPDAGGGLSRWNAPACGLSLCGDRATGEDLGRGANFPTAQAAMDAAETEAEAAPVAPNRGAGGAGDGVHAGETEGRTWIGRMTGRSS